MSTLKVNKLRDTSGSTDAIVLDPSGGAVLAGVTTVSTVKVGSGVTISSDGDVFATGVSTCLGTAVLGNAIVGAAVTITSDGIEASGIGITCANINGTQIGGTRNLVINGSQIFDQRNGGSAVTPSNASSTFITDRFMVFEDTDGVVSAQQSTTAPDGFTKSLKIDCTTADTSLAVGQRLICETRIEGNNIAHLGFGSSAAKTLTLSFYVRSNLTGTFGGVIKNSANNRVYIFSYSISSANTWERKTITIPGDTTGTWLTTNGTGIIINWGLALGSNWTGTAGSYGTSDKHGVTGQLNLLSSTDNEWLLTGVQLEVGSQATAFEHRSFGDELALCQRYCMKWWNHGNTTNNHSRFAPGYYATTTSAALFFNHPVAMRATDGRTLTHNIGNMEQMSGGGNSNSLSLMADGSYNTSTTLLLTGLSGVTANNIYVGRVGGGQTDWYIIISCEL